MLLKIIFVIGLIGFCDVYLVVLAARTITIGGAVAMCLATAALGGYLFKREGWKTLQEFSAATKRLEMPGEHLAHGLLILVGGAFLMTPGFITDLIGFIFLLPFSRNFIASKVMKAVGDKINVQVMMPGHGARSNAREREADVIDIK